MKPETMKYALGSGLAVILLGGLVLLRNELMAPAPAPVVANATETGNKVEHSKASAQIPQEKPAPSTQSSDANTTAADPLHGLPVLTWENIDINPEKPPEMPLKDWEEYERQRYEMVQLKAYKFRQTDPSKVKPALIEVAVPEAAKKYDIPQELLAALLMGSSDGGHHQAEHDIEGGFGLMMLKESPQCDSLGEAAQLLNVSKEDLIYDQKLNVMGGAAVLRQYFDDAKASGLDDSEAWYMAVSQYSGRPQPNLASALADQVAGYMIKGFEIDSEDGSGYYLQDANPNPIFLPKNWKVAAVDPPAGGTAEAKQQANATGNDGTNDPPAANN